MKIYIIITAIVCTAISCDTILDNEIEKHEEYNTLTITVNSSEEVESKVLVGENNTVEWEEGESLLAYWIDTQSQGELKMVEHSAKSATFSGETLGENLRLVTPFLSDAEITAGQYTIDISEQNEGFDSTYMISDEPLSLSDTSVSLVHIGTIITLEIYFTSSTSTEDYTLTKVEIEGLPTQAILALDKEISSDEFCTTSSEKPLSITTNQSIDTQSPALVRFNSLPFELKPGDALEITLYFTSSSGESLSQDIRKGNSSDLNIEFGRATYNTIICSCDVSSAEAFSTISLKEIHTENIPSTSKWVITDSSAEGSDFSSLSTVIEYLGGSGRQISLEFPYLEAIPERAIFGGEAADSAFNSSALVSVSAASATSIGDYAFTYCTMLKEIDFPAATTLGAYSFRGCTALSSVILESATLFTGANFYGCSSLDFVELPKVTSMGGYTFYNCSSLSTVALATDSDTELESISSTCFKSANTSNIDLTVGQQSAKYISNGTTFSLGDFSATFKSIAVNY